MDNEDEILIELFLFIEELDKEEPHERIEMVEPDAV
jgi:hypothetical protein